MSTDAKITDELVQILHDGEQGFSKAAEKLNDSDRPEIAGTFRRFSAQRAAFADELQKLAGRYGDNIEESGSVKGTLHRSWITLKDALTGSDPTAVLKAAEQGEDHAVEQYRTALEADVSPELRTVVARQFDEVKSAHDTVRALRDDAEKR